MTATAPTHADATPTEAAAAKRASKWAETLEARVLAAVVEAAEYGLTAREAREVLGLPVEKQYSISPRLSALKKKGLVEPTGWSRDGFMAYAATAEGGPDWCASDGVISVCGTDMEEHSRRSEGVKWCFHCRKRHEFWWVVMVPAGLSYYGPSAGMEGVTSACSDLFPGRYYEIEEG